MIEKWEGIKGRRDKAKQEYGMKLKREKGLEESHEKGRVANDALTK